LEQEEDQKDAREGDFGVSNKIFLLSGEVILREIFLSSAASLAQVYSLCANSVT
jgi:hypothetical protein